ncbi:MAG: DUF47 family protein [Candidatus Cloacimonetes bacterium]|nr:DUF47 family protein [Candidatus Cloacimonadota bacterium]
MPVFFRKTEKLIKDIDDFRVYISKASVLFKKAIYDYLHEDNVSFEEQLKQVAMLEGNADELRRDIERTLYSYTLIPEARGAVLALLEKTDNVIDIMKETLLQFSIEKPEIPNELDKMFEQLTEASLEAVDAFLGAFRSYFNDQSRVNEYIQRVHMFESEADRKGEQILRQVFAMDIELARKNQLRVFIHYIESISDYAEEVADRLAIFTIKRQI